ncbi:hypothetical protein F511_36230 [Dorcoceras hygrometricum]|uniref:Uncharacterized protein n=1 Tax=Dorcoceras hygrometricum TaxID=472368 RepID=A0A2Z7AP32_9LAMI|nr:hypothetical protein F511_36230 [Dorcoceras hygrometricum]
MAGTISGEGGGGGGGDRSTTGCETPSSACTRRPDEIGAYGFSSSRWPEQFPAREAAAAAATTALRGRRGGGRRTLSSRRDSADTFSKSNQQMLLRSADERFEISADTLFIAKRRHLNKLTRHRFIAKEISRWKNTYAYQQMISFRCYSSRSSLTTTMKIVLVTKVISGASSKGFKYDHLLIRKRFVRSYSCLELRRQVRKEERYRRDEEDNERTVDRSKDKSKDKFKERSNDRKMKTSSNKRFSRKHDRKVLVAEESTKSWADSDSDSSSSSSSSSDSEQEEVHYFMADQTDDDEVFDFSNVEFTRDDLVIALNDMVKEYRKLSHSFEEAKAENMSLKSSSIDSNSDEFEDIDILKTELSKLQAKNEMLKDEASELKAEVNKLTVEMSTWNKANLSLYKLYESQKPLSDKTGIGFNNSEFCEGESSTQSRSVYDKFNKMSFVKADMMYNCLESVKYDNQNSPKLNENGKAGIGFSKPERFKPNWLKNRLDKDKAKASQKPFGEPGADLISVTSAEHVAAGYTQQLRVYC